MKPVAPLAAGFAASHVKYPTMHTSGDSKRIAKNTLLLYGRMILLMLVALYTSRVILQALGVTDFGIYNAVGGFVAMFSVLTGSLSAAISRFITFELGKGDKEKLTRIFSTAVIIQLLIGLVIIVLVEAFGIWFLNHKMSIPPDRLTAANWVLQFSLLTFAINLLSVPYNATIIAHERMSAFAYISLLEAACKLLIAFLVGCAPFDNLIFYGLLMCLVALLVRSTYALYCKRHFAECHVRWRFERGLFREIAGFAGWNFIGASSGVLRDQGVNVLLNVFCGPAVNAARGIAMQVSSAVNQFVRNFQTAINPQITKSYAQGDADYLIKLVFQGSRLSFYMLLLFSLPIIMETHTILRLWLNIVPEHTVMFVRLILVFVMTESISNPLITLMLATGKIRNYQLIVGGCQLLNFPLAYVLLKMGLPPESTVVLSIAVACLCLATRLYMLRSMVKLPVRRFLQKVVLNILAVSLLSAILPCLIVESRPETLTRFFIVVVVSLLSTFLCAFYVGCSKAERHFVLAKASQLLQKIRHGKTKS